MKNFGTIFAALFIAVVLFLYMCTFQVRFTEEAVVKTWGKPAKDAIVEPGLKFKWPAPIQTAVVYDKRVRVLEDRTEETRTVDGKNVLLTTFTLWRISDPVKFNTNFPGGVEEGESKLRTTIIAQKAAVVGQRPFQQFISTDPKERKMREIENQIRDAVEASAADEYGIEVIDFGIKQLGLPETVTSAIFDSMKSNEENKASDYRSQGKAEATKIQAEAKASEQRILAAAQQKSEQIRADAERVVSEYYKEFRQHPELRIFLDKLRSLREALQERTTLIIDTHTAPFDVMSEAGRKIEPEKDTPK